MARPINKGLSYYPIDCNHFDDRKIKRLIRSHAGNGYMVYQYLLSLVYSNGYFLKHDEELNFDVADSLRIDEIEVENIIKKCLDLGLFNIDMFDKHGIFTSLGIQKRWLKIIKEAKRKDKIESDYLIYSEETPINSEETRVNSEETPINSELMQQRKEKKRKEKERKENQINQKEETDVDFDCLTDSEFIFFCKDKKVTLSNKDIQALIKQYPNVDVIAYLKSFSAYCKKGDGKIPLATNLMNVVNKSLQKKQDDYVPIPKQRYPLLK